MPRGLVEEISARAAGRIALAEPSSGYRVSYDDLLSGVDRIARQLRTVGIEHGARVGLLVANGPELIAAFLGVTAAGAAAAPINPGLTPSEIETTCAELGLSAMVADPIETRPEIRDICRAAGMQLLALDRAPRVELVAIQPAGGSNPEPSPNDICLLLQTSGTTSTPKAVPLRQRNLLASATNIADFYSLTPADVTYCVMPLFHIHGLVGAALATLSSGGTVVVPRRVATSRFVSHLAENGVTWVSAVPTTLARLLSALPDPAPSTPLRFGRTSSSTLPADLAERFEAKTGAPLVDAYGMTEASHQMTSNPLPPRQRRRGSVGLPTGTRIAIVDEHWSELPQGANGEVAVKGPGVIDAYLNTPRANEESFREGWFRTGDAGSLAPDGYLTLAGRIKELINRGGEKVAPSEVEDVLLSHGAVEEAVAYAAPDPKYGEAVHAVVVVSQEVQQDELLLHCRESLASFKMPSRLVFADQIPRLPTGKVQRSSLAKTLER